MNNNEWGKNTPIVNWLKRQIRQKNTPLIIFCGPTRSGKTAFAMRVAYETWGKKFTYEHVVNTIEDFALAMKNNTHSCIILDEATVSLFVYDWANFLHKIFTVIQDTQAFKHNVAIVILPQISHLSTQQKQMADVIIEMKKIRGWNETAGRSENQYFYKYLKPHKQYSSLNTEKIWVTEVGTFGPVPLPPDHIWKPYIDKGQTEFKQKILDDQLDIISQKAKARSSVQVEKPVF